MVYISKIYIGANPNGCVHSAGCCGGLVEIIRPSRTVHENPLNVIQAYVSYKAGHHSF